MYAAPTSARRRSQNGKRRSRLSGLSGVIVFDYSIPIASDLVLNGLKSDTSEL